MTRYEKSDAQLDAEASADAPDVRPCTHCGKPYLDGFPHRHETPPKPGYDPMPERPATVYCNQLDVNSYWLGTFTGACCMVHLAGHEYRGELHWRHARLTVRYVPPALEPIPQRDDAMPEVGNVEQLAAGRWRASFTGSDMERHFIYARDEQQVNLRLAIAVKDQERGVTDSGSLGAPSWSPLAHRRFGGVTRSFGGVTVQSGDYKVFPWSRAIEKRLPNWCYRRHLTRPELYYEHRGQAICPDVVKWIVERGYPLVFVASQLHVSPVRMEELVASALDIVWTDVANQIGGSAGGERLVAA